MAKQHTDFSDFDLPGGWGDRWEFEVEHSTTEWIYEMVITLPSEDKLTIKGNYKAINELFVNVGEEFLVDRDLQARQQIEDGVPTIFYVSIEMESGPILISGLEKNVWDFLWGRV